MISMFWLYRYIWIHGVYGWDYIGKILAGDWNRGKEAVCAQVEDMIAASAWRTLEQDPSDSIFLAPRILSSVEDSAIVGYSGWFYDHSRTLKVVIHGEQNSWTILQ
ncbi:hypothetical protein TWF225_009300 [Orbilia oligospora]|uniref:Uncharacterized protein n=1 Tax=Orbilia oligospora TaxID=2813651 RepID=A0A7C8PSF9_ORBOL|nr:hypothetical protein TWF751_001871 [Orbilia oligospora]KAF3193757.1 hypothetical protein TWF225_009300 [Orbilia oligospora]KAF3269941.1 hypothetical protein TWF217_008284 [Orbilia oligospora]KAF3270402.1 hypothetical protein TWF128_004175 [Orbilia oligospora]KAF3298111.1 hypothetical protein TWF132_004252 [Orbilia oligospora]